MSNAFAMTSLFPTKSYKLHTLMLTSVLFSGAALCSEKNYLYYVYNILAISVGSLFYIFSLPKTAGLLLRNKFFWWILVLFSFFEFYGLVLPVYDEFNADYVFFIGVVVVNVIVWFVNIPADDAVKILLQSAAIAALALCVFLTLNESAVVLEQHVRLGTSGSGNENTIGLWFGVFSMLSLYGVVIEKKNLYIVAYVLQLLFMTLTGSKKTVIFIIMGVFMLSLLKAKVKFYKYIIPAVAIICLFYFVLNNDFLFEILGQRLLDFLGQIGIDVPGARYSYSTDIRLQMIQIGWEAFLQSPIFGSGWFYFSEYSGLETYSHNNYIELLVTYGIVGIVLYYGMFIYLLTSIFKRLRHNDYGKLFFTVILSIMISDYASVTFQESTRYFIVLFFAFMFTRKNTAKGGATARLDLGDKP